MQQPGDCTPKQPLKNASQVDNHPDSEQQQDVQDEEGFIFWTEPLQKTSIVYAIPGDHFDTHGLLLQAVLKQGLGVGGGVS